VFESAIELLKVGGAQINPATGVNYAISPSMKNLPEGVVLVLGLGVIHGVDELHVLFVKAHDSLLATRPNTSCVTDGSSTSSSGVGVHVKPISSNALRSA